MSDITAIDVLRNYQKQCDADGIEVQVSRQALDEVLDRHESLEAENAALREAIKCVWVRWHEWRDDQYAATLLALEKAIDEAGELIPPPEEQK